MKPSIALLAKALMWFLTPGRWNSTSPKEVRTMWIKNDNNLINLDNVTAVKAFPQAAGTRTAMLEFFSGQESIRIRYNTDEEMYKAYHDVVSLVSPRVV